MIRITDPISLIPHANNKKFILFSKELRITTVNDLIEYFPIKYEDNKIVNKLSDIMDTYVDQHVIVNGTLKTIQKLKSKKGKLYIEAILNDESGYIKLVWFKGIDYVIHNFKVDNKYCLSGVVDKFADTITLVHPTIVKTKNDSNDARVTPIYPTTERLKKFFINSKYISKVINETIVITEINENLPQHLLDKYQLMSRYEALKQIHNPRDLRCVNDAKRRLKYEELFFLQLKLLITKQIKMYKTRGYIMEDTSLFKDFYAKYLPFALTESQKNAIRECYHDMHSGHQMNRLLQGDVGSGKTIVAFMVMLIAISNGYQVAMMVPTEILAEQHYKKISNLAKELNLNIALLTGSTATSARKRILYDIQQGLVHILIGTHSLINSDVEYKSLGLMIIDEQHRFGVEQRANVLRGQAHILIMTATPIPRTLAMTVYGDLDISTLKELPSCRKKVKTIHLYEPQRGYMIQLVQQQLDLGHQVYFIYPLIDESAKMENLKDLNSGYEFITNVFPSVPISVVHGNSDNKDSEMEKFNKGETLIMLSTTVVEVGIDVPNATVMVIENAERFGLAQLHQLRGRIGRSSFQSYCILMTEYNLSKYSKDRINTMVEAADGFHISNVDLKLRGAGDVTGTQQSGSMSMKIVDIQTDQHILRCAREDAKQILTLDPMLEHNQKLKDEMTIKLDTNYGNVG